VSEISEPDFQYWKRKTLKMENFGGKVKEEIFFA
jgi:hypothetical protein